MIIGLLCQGNIDYRLKCCMNCENKKKTLQEKVITKNCYHSTLGCKFHEDRNLKKSITEGIINNASEFVSLLHILSFNKGKLSALMITICNHVFSSGLLSPFHVN